MPIERRDGPVDLKERQDGIEIELIVDAPDAQAMPVVVDREAALPAGGDAPGQLADVATAREKLANMVMPADALPVEVNVAGMQDEITDEQALAFAMRGQQRGAPVGDPVVGPEPVDPVPQNLPDVIRRAVFDPNRRHARLPREPEWLTVYQLPRYLEQGIRALGRSIFNVFPCFERHRLEAELKGEDPLGSIGILANLQGGGPSDQGELDVVATWIRANGVPIEATELEMPAAIPGYRPRVILAVSEEKSYLMVDERRENGAPIDAQYIYSWTGGQVHYLANPQHMQRLGGMAEDDQRRRIEPPRRALAAPHHRAAPVLPAAPPVEPTQIKAPDPELRKRRIAALQQAPATPGGLIMELRRTGFLPHGAQQTPSFRRELDDGSTVDITGEEGIPASRTAQFDMVVRDPDGHEIWSGRIASVDEMEAGIAVGQASPSP